MLNKLHCHSCDFLKFHRDIHKLSWSDFRVKSNPNISYFIRLVWFKFLKFFNQLD